MKILTLLIIFLSAATITSSGSLSITKSQPTETESAHGGRRVSRSSGDSSIPSPKATQVEGVPAVPFSTDSALILRHFGLHDVTLGPPSIARNAHPTNVTASLGRTARLRCRILNLAQKSVSWVRHNDVSLISVGKYKYIKDSRFRVMNEYPKLQDWELVINDVKLKDQGQYECQVNTSPILQQAFFLSVVEPYTEIVGGSKEVFFIDQHSVINLTCVVHSPEPPVHLFWKHNNQIQVTFQLVISRPGVPKVAATGFAGRTAVVHVIDDRTELVQSASGLSSFSSSPATPLTVSSLLIRNARPSDSGTYVCNPSNTKPAQITVQVLDGESTDALQTSGLSTFTASKKTLAAMYAFSWTALSIYR